MSADSDWTFVDNIGELEKAVKKLRGSKWIAFDLEADSLHSYPERVCLIQLGCESGAYLIDSLALTDLSLLFAELGKRELIIHGCDYDLRLLARQYQFRPKKVFDTKEAARMIGMRHFGLSSLTGEFFGVELEKSGQKADWSQRPLKDSLLDYARKDVAYLNPMKELLEKKLRQLGRDDWHRECCERLIVLYSRVEEPDMDAVWRIKGYAKLNRIGLSVLRSMWQWREEEAVRLNRPPFFVLPHKKMVEIADLVSMKKPYVDLIPRKFPAKRRAGLLASIQSGLAVESADRPRREVRSSRRVRIPNGERVFTYEELRCHRDQLADRLEMDPTVIASRSDLEMMACNWHEAGKELMKWQWELMSECRKLDPVENNKANSRSSSLR
ncbi:MAG: HRDC domain-containing protein [Verrucomicrobia bacterium]|nr:HRDC domain-containing protein [Verrucomicrobiota bacterium]